MDLNLLRSKLSIGHNLKQKTPFGSTDFKTPVFCLLASLTHQMRSSNMDGCSLLIPILGGGFKPFVFSIPKLWGFMIQFDEHHIFQTGG